MEKPLQGRNRVVIEQVQPELDGGRFAIKRVVGDRVVVEADIFADGHDKISCTLLYRQSGDEWLTEKMVPVGNDRWRGGFQVVQPGPYFYTIAAAMDPFETWRSDMLKRMDAGQNAGEDFAVQLEMGADLMEKIAGRASSAERLRLRALATLLRETGRDGITAALHPSVAEMAGRYPDPELETRLERELVLTVERKRAEFSAWYELFPRSLGQGRHGTLQDCIAFLPRIAELGFDVLYLPPIHPIGKSFRKGKNNTTAAEPEDVGSPWAIGSEAGGHMAVHPELGTLEDVRQLAQEARRQGMELALDIAFQCSPDHPWVKEHPEWFRKRPDGTIQYAENPPKKYQDIYPLYFESEQWTELWDALRDVFLFWLEQGVRIFRVDNPHTKAFAFWEWVLAEVRQREPEAIFLSEAFTRPRVMQRLAKVGFSQSYTYFTWRNTKQELTDYARELTESQTREYLRPNFWPNTPDILPESLQVGGRAAFLSRLALAATLSASYGVYGPAFELYENQPRDPGGEEYLNSEKYELKQWDWEQGAEAHEWMRRLNAARKANPALQSNRNLRFHEVGNPMLLCYSKRTESGENSVLTVVNLDPFHTQSGWISLDKQALGLRAGEPFQVEDALTDRRLLWNADEVYVSLNPEAYPASVFRILRRVRTERDFDYYL